jgi:C1A family cysteine protease
MIVVGYLQGQGFIVKNSWGSDWGSNGFCVLAPEYLAWNATNDLWVPTLGTVFS